MEQDSLPPIRVLLLGKNSPPRWGGVERHLEALFDGFHAVGGVTVDLLSTNDRMVSRIDRWNGFRTIRSSRLLDLNRLPIARSYPWWLSTASDVLATAPSYALWLRKLGDADVIHMHTPSPVVEAAVLAVRPRAPVVVTEHCSVPTTSPVSGSYMRMHAAVLDRADAIIVQSPPFLEHSLLTEEQRRSASVIPSAIDTSRYGLDRAAAARTLRAGPGDKPTVLFVGRLVDYKGLEFLVHAMADAPGALLIVGQGLEEPRLRALARAEGLGERVRFLGPLDDPTVRALMEAADVLALPSIDNREGFGLVLLEAHQMGTPTISTELGTGTSWVNEHERTGLVVPPRDAAALAGAIGRIAASPTEAAAWGKAAQERARTEFSVEEMARRTIDVYRTVAGQVGRQTRL
jgi:rhamnosyl/mannosyltransferase